MAYDLNPPVFQSSTVTPGHLVVWTTNGVIQDSGFALGATGTLYAGGTFLGPIAFAVGALPTASTGLPSGAVWNNGGVLCVA